MKTGRRIASLDPGSVQVELAYVGLQVGDRGAFDRFLQDVIGLVPAAERPAEPATSGWRNDDRVHRILVKEGPKNDAIFLGFEHAAEDFDAAVERLRSTDIVVQEGDAAMLRARQVERLVWADSPWGPRVELVQGLARSATPFASELVPGGFHTRGVGFGHAVFQVGGEDAFEEAHRFAIEGLGLAQSDWFEGAIGPASVLARFYHCNARHHTLALARVPSQPEQALNHIMLETVNEENVGAAYDRAYNSDVTIESGLGRHDNDRMFSFYAVTPAGFRMEFGYGAREIVQPWTQNRRYDRPSVWGHQPVARPHLV